MTKTRQRQRPHLPGRPARQKPHSGSLAHLSDAPTDLTSNSKSIHIEPAFVDKHGGRTYTSRSIRALDYARQHGDLPFYKCGRKILFKIEDLENWMSRFRVDVTEIEDQA